MDSKTTRTFLISEQTVDNNDMIIWKKLLSSLTLVLILICSNQVSIAQATNPAQSDILDFIPAIIAAAMQNRQTLPPPKPTSPPVVPPSGSGNFRYVKTDIYNRMSPLGKMSELITTWNSSGNDIRSNLSVFALFAGNPSQVQLTTTANRVYNSQNKPLSEDFLSQFITGPQAGNQTSGIKRYHYNNSGRLHSTTSESFTNGAAEANSETIFQYGGNNRLLGAAITTSKNGAVNTTEQHTLSYDANNRVTSHQVVRTSVFDNSSELILHTHRYDTAGNLVESITLAPRFKNTLTYLQMSGNKRTTRAVSVDRSTNTVTSRFDIETTFASGICTLRGRNDPLVIEANITASVPYSPNAGCIKR